MSEDLQVIIKNETDANAIEHHRVMDILNPILHHHDLLHSYVRTRTEVNLDSKKKFEEFEEQSKETYPAIINNNNNSNNNDNICNAHNKRKSNNDKKDKEKFDVATIESEMKIQKSRRKRRQQGNSHRQEEVYTDKDRAAAVNMGTTDIKQSLKLKQRQDRNRALQIPEEAEPGAFLTLGLREMSVGDINIAINCINKVLNLNPNDKNALVARSKCHLLLGDPQKALDDAEAALQLNPKDSSNSKAIYSKAEALYHLGDFEMSLVYYYRGMRIRPEFGRFRLGVQKAKDAIQKILRKN